MKTLFVGGLHDGEWYEVINRLPIYKLQAPTATRPSRDPCKAEGVRLEEEYSLQTWFCGKTLFYFYALVGMSPLKTMEMVFDGYRRPKE